MDKIVFMVQIFCFSQNYLLAERNENGFPGYPDRVLQKRIIADGMWHAACGMWQDSTDDQIIPAQICRKSHTHIKL